MKKMHTLFFMIMFLAMAGCGDELPPNLPDTLNDNNSIPVFSFRAEDNSMLSDDVECQIDDDLIYCVVPYDSTNSNRCSLTATFTTTTADGNTQTNRVDGINYKNADIEFKVTAENGTTEVYRVRVFMHVTRYELDNLIAENSDVRRLHTADITDMSELLKNNTSFNQDISLWDVSGVTDMNHMFYYASAFNQDISSWNVGNVTDMSDMFLAASTFNQDISQWNVSNVANMKYMFNSATAFNQDISQWNVSNVTDMSFMFYNAKSFNQDISEWNNHVGENIRHDYFSWGCPLQEIYLPYTSWSE